VQTFFHTTVADDLDSNVEVFRIAAKRANIVICSGGLGPTADDLTRDAFAMAFDRPLELRDEALSHIKSLFAARKRAMPEQNMVQAMFPMGSRIIPNPHGTAPGIDLAVNTFRQDGSIQACRFFALPGVPAEMNQMWNETVQSRLKTELGVGANQWFFEELKVFGIGESDCEALLPDLIKRVRLPRVGITVHQATITLRIAILASSRAEAEIISQPTKDEIRAALGDLVFGTNGDELHTVVHQQLVEANQSLSVIEFGDAAIIAPWLASLKASSTGTTNSGMVVSGWYRTDPREAHLSRSRGTLGQETNEDREVELDGRALDLRTQLNTDWCLIVGPYPSPDAIGSMRGLPAFDFSITLVGPDNSVVRHELQLGGHPDIILKRLGKTGLDYLRKRLSERNNH